MSGQLRNMSGQVRNMLGQVRNMSGGESKFKRSFAGFKLFGLILTYIHRYIGSYITHALFLEGPLPLKIGTSTATLTRAPCLS